MKTPKNIFFVFLGLVAVTIAIGGGLIYLFDAQLSTVNQNIGKLLADQDAINKQIQIYNVAKQKIDELSFVGNLANSVLPPSKEQANLVAELKKFIVDAGLTLESLNFSGSDAAIAGVDISQTQAQADLKGVRVLPVTAVIKTGASYTQIIKLLETIENSQRKMQVKELSLTPEVSTNTFSSTSIKIDVYMRDKVLVAPADSDNASDTGIN